MLIASTMVSDKYYTRKLENNTIYPKIQGVAKKPVHVREFYNLQIKQAGFMFFARPREKVDLVSIKSGFIKNPSIKLKILKVPVYFFATPYAYA